MDSQPKSLWISVQPHWTEAFLTGIFSGFPGFVKAAIIGNKGYGFLDFDSNASASAVLTAMDNHPVPGDVMGQRFRLRWGNRGGSSNAAAAAPGASPSESGKPEFSIFVGDLPYDATEASITEFFSTFYSSTAGAHIVTEPGSGKSKGYGFVRFTNEQEQQRALAEMGGKEFGGRPLRVGEATPKPDGRKAVVAAVAPRQVMPPIQAAAPHGVVPGAAATLPLGYLPSALAPQAAWPAPGVPDMSMHGQMVGYGGVSAAPALMPLAPGMPAGAAQAALGSGTNSDPTYKAEVASIATQPFAPPPAVTEGNTTVFVGGLDKNATEAELRFHFHRCGPVSSVKVLQDKGCGFVQFQYRAHAEAAISSLNGSVLGIGPLRLQWGKNAARNAMAAQAALPGAAPYAAHPAAASAPGFPLYSTGAPLQAAAPMSHAHMYAMQHAAPLQAAHGFAAAPLASLSAGMPALAAHGPGVLPGAFATPASAPATLGVSGALPAHSALDARALLAMHGAAAGDSLGGPAAPASAGLVNASHLAQHDLSMVAGVHNPWSFSAPEQKAVGSLWGSVFSPTHTT